nr:putative natalisin precursor [Homarus americanus]
MCRRGDVMWLTVCVVVFIAATVQSSGHQSQDLDKRLGPGSPPAASEGQSRRLGGRIDEDEEGQEVQGGQGGQRGQEDSPREARSFWAMRGKRPSSELLHQHHQKRSGSSGWSSNDDEDVSDGERSVAGRRRSFGGSGSSSGTFWVARGKKAMREYLPLYWGSNQNMWGETPFRRWPSTEGVEASSSQQQHRQLPQPSTRLQVNSGWESNQSLWGKRDGGGPFWIARGKRQETEGNGGPFWIARGKKDIDSGVSWGAVAQDDDDQWQDDVTYPHKRQDGGPFWISRGKKDTPALLRVGHPSLWGNRGRKSEDERTFWVARGKKDAVDGRAPFWISRGKKENKGNESELFWISRGKREGEAPPFWVSRGKKEGEETHPFWVSRGKKEGEETHPFWVSRGKKESEWSKRKGPGPPTPTYTQLHADHITDPVMAYVLHTLLDQYNDTLTDADEGDDELHDDPHHYQPQQHGHKGKKDTTYGPIDDPFVKGFLALRG